MIAFAQQPTKGGTIVVVIDDATWSAACDAVQAVWLSAEQCQQAVDELAKIVDEWAKEQSDEPEEQDRDGRGSRWAMACGHAVQRPSLLRRPRATAREGPLVQLAGLSQPPLSVPDISARC